MFKLSWLRLSKRMKFRRFVQVYIDASVSSIQETNVWLLLETSRKKIFHLLAVYPNQFYRLMHWNLPQHNLSMQATKEDWKIKNNIHIYREQTLWIRLFFDFSVIMRCIFLCMCRFIFFTFFHSQLLTNQEGKTVIFLNFMKRPKTFFKLSTHRSFSMLFDHSFLVFFEHIYDPNLPFWNLLHAFDCVAIHVSTMKKKYRKECEYKRVSTFFTQNCWFIIKRCVTKHIGTMCNDYARSFYLHINWKLIPVSLGFPLFFTVYAILDWIHSFLRLFIWLPHTHVQKVRLHFKDAISPVLP